MRTHWKPVGAAMLAMVTACSGAPTDMATAPDEPMAAAAARRVIGSVTGGAHFTVGPIGEEGWRTSSVSARLHADGTAGGQAQFKNRWSGNEMHMEVTCVNFMPNGRAFVGGTITRGEPLAAGDLAGFFVEDNGQGAQAAPDRSSGWFGAFLPEELDFSCNTDIPAANPFWNNTLLVVESGNLQVSPP